jgi:hypothetical protein
MEDKRKILEKLYEERVFRLDLFEDRVDFIDGCDECFGLILYKKDLADLIKELKEIHDNLI